MLRSRTFSIVYYNCQEQQDSASEQRSFPKETSLNRLLIILVFSLIATASFRGAANTHSDFYVSTIGNDSNAGTRKKPFRTLQHAADKATPGQIINVQGGSYCERLAVNSSGSAIEGYITFRSQPGESAVLDGSCMTPAVGDSAMIALHNVSYVRIQGFEVRNYKTRDRTRAPFGIRVWGSGSHIQILNNNVHNIEQTYPGRLGPGHGANGFGIAVYGTDAKTPISDLIVDGNQVHHLQTGSSESLVLNGNVTNFRVTRNRVHNNNNIGIDIRRSIAHATGSSARIRSTTLLRRETPPMETMYPPTASTWTAGRVS
jgi:hypothetical protein